MADPVPVDHDCGLLPETERSLYPDLVTCRILQTGNHLVSLGRGWSVRACMQNEQAYGFILPKKKHDFTCKQKTLWYINENNYKELPFNLKLQGGVLNFKNICLVKKRYVFHYLG